MKKKKKVTYCTTRKNAIKEFEKTISLIQELYTKFENSISKAEDCLDDIESGLSRKKIAKVLDKVYNDFDVLAHECKNLTEDFGICIDNFLDIKQQEH